MNVTISSNCTVSNGDRSTKSCSCNLEKKNWGLGAATRSPGKDAKVINDLLEEIREEIGKIT
jgi:hypothetical protein